MKQLNRIIFRTFAIAMALMFAPFISSAYADKPNSKLETVVKKNSLWYFLYKDTITNELYATVCIDYDADKKQEIPETLRVEPFIKYQKQKYSLLEVGGLHGDYGKSVITTVFLPPTVKIIDDLAFYKMKKLKSVIYDTQKGQLTEIGKNAFDGCTSLAVAPYATTVCQGTTLKSIGNSAFVGCSNLYAFSLPSSIDSIGYSAFENCTSLYIFNFPRECTIRTLGWSTFKNCTILRQIHIPEGVKSIELSCFSQSGLTEAWFPSTLTTIGSYAFSNCKDLTRTHFKDGYYLKRIEQGAFSDCSKLETIDDCNTQTYENCGLRPKYIGNSAFSGCSKLVSTFFFNSCDTIGDFAFNECTSFKKIDCSGSYLGSRAFSGCTALTEARCYTKHISGYAFYGCTALQKVFLGNTEYIGSSAFNCHTASKSTSLEHVYGLRPDIEYGSEYLWSIFDYVRTNNQYDGYGCYYRHIENSYQYNVLKAVRPAIKEWEQKKDYEKTSQWAERVTEENREKELKRLIEQAKEAYIKNYAPSKPKYRLGKYDADAEVYAFTMDDCKSKAYVTVPSSEMTLFKDSFNNATFTPEYCIKEDKVDLARCAVTVNGKTYTSPTLYEDDSTAVVSINLSPLQINIPTNKSKNNLAQAPKQKSAVDTNIPTISRKSDKVFVVIIGNENYSDPSVSSASYAQNDANIFEQYCLKTLGIPQNNIHKKLDATRNQIRSEVKWLTSIEDAFGNEAEIIFYYSGHGMPDEKMQKTYLLPSDGMANDPESAYALTTLYAQLGELDVKKVSIFLDACFSGSQRDGGMLTASKGVAIKVKPDVPSGKTIIFSAASGDETAYPNQQEGHGMFTYYLLKKLQDTKGDVTLKDLGDYITTNVRQQSIVINGKSQTPNVTATTSLGTEWQGWKLR